MPENKINASELVDIATIKIDPNLSKIEKLIEYIRQIKDPFHYKCGKFIVTACHPESGPTLEDCLHAMMV